MKHPDHPVPSGDRMIARLFIEIFEILGHEVTVLSAQSSWEGQGNPGRQEELRRRVSLDLERRVQDEDSGKLDLVFVYHVYHKSPDWLGLGLARFLDIPYLLAETSFSPRQSGGPWDSGHKQTKQCILSADAILCLNPVDEPCLKELLPDSQVLERVRPFMPEPDLTRPAPRREDIACKYQNLDAQAVWLVCVAMMRSGDKLRSYCELSAALETIADENWNLVVIGDGARSREVKSLFSRFGDRCLFTGELDPARIASWFRTADCYVWPSVNEAFGMALLEAVSYGLPSLAYDYGGVGAIIEDGENGFLVSSDDRPLFADRLKLLINDQATRCRMRAQARKKFLSDHSVKTAQAQISGILKRFDASS